jgi:hypothetical protein
MRDVPESRIMFWRDFMYGFAEVLGRGAVEDEGGVGGVMSKPSMLIA